MACIDTKANNQRPKTLVCYICGREYGTRSLEIHVKTCEKKWDYEQNKLIKAKRKPCPPAPPGFKNMIRMAQGKKALKGHEMPPEEAEIGGGFDADQAQNNPFGSKGVNPG